MNTEQIQKFWDSLEAEQKSFIKDFLNFLILGDSKKKILKSLHNKKIFDLDLDEHIIVLLRNNKFIFVDDLKYFGLDNLSELKGFDQETIEKIRKEIILISKK